MDSERPASPLEKQNKWTVKQLEDMYLRGKAQRRGVLMMAAAKGLSGAPITSKEYLILCEEFEEMRLGKIVYKGEL